MVAQKASNTKIKPMQISENIPLAPYTTFKIGGPARYFCEAEAESDVITALTFAKDKSLPVFILGGGSNLLVSDSGFDGLVLRIAIAGEPLLAEEDMIITAPAGMDWDAFVAFCVGNNLAGVECLSGIPGLVGGTPVQNVGAYGQEVAQTIISVRALNRITGEIVEISNAECGFSYRTSRFNSTEIDTWIILGVTYKLIENGAPNLTYRDLQDAFTHTPTLAEMRETVIRIRSQKGMVIREGEPDCQSAGSFFKNPLVPQELAPEGAPGWPSEKMVKVPAAWLIEQAGFPKGYKKGNAGLSTRHTLALTNRGGATAAEIYDLMTEIQSGVWKKFGIHIHPEPIFLGFAELS
jgi:UDP-N-acetylmuramate dehydrogenase